MNGVSPYEIAEGYKDPSESEKEAVAGDLLEKGYEWELEETGYPEETPPAQGLAEQGYEWQLSPQAQIQAQYELQRTATLAEIDDLEARRRKAEGAKVSLPLKIVVFLAVGAMDIVEIVSAISAAVTIAGQGLTITAKAGAAWVQGVKLGAKALKLASVIALAIPVPGLDVLVAGALNVLSAALKIIGLAAETYYKGVAAALKVTGLLTTVIGIAWNIFMFIFGLLVSGGVYVLLLLKGVVGVFAVRILIVLMAGLVLDAATAGILPARTIAVAITIWLHNRECNKKLKRIRAELTERQEQLTVLERHLAVAPA